jgi:hypothetical protein
MLRLTDAALEHLQTFSAPIPHWRRAEYLQLVSSALAGNPDPQPAQVHKACRAAQQAILHGPRSNGGELLDGRTGEPLTPREQFSQEAMRNPKFKIASGDNLGFVIGGHRPK